MQFVHVSGDGSLSLQTGPDPSPGPGELLLEVWASGVNRADLMQRAGLYPPPAGASPILGLECAGVVLAVGEGVEGFLVGDRVCALLAGGGYASRVVCDARVCLPIPEGLSFVEGAAILEVFTTAWLNLREEGALRPGERVLVWAAASGVGTAALQLCGMWGNPVWAVASAPKLKVCLELGAAGATDRRAGDLAADVRAFTDGHGLDVILDPVGASALDLNLRALAVGGRLVLIGLMGGREAPIDLGRVLMKRLRIQGSTLRGRSAAEKGRLLTAMREALWPSFADGRLRPILDRAVPVHEVEQALDYVASDASVGKVVLSWNDAELEAT
ncbi:MAG: NAD(P)H-quinone oxidoreductase [Deltaproteobacteria bacterium]|nr:NAD(P)H-quinone oxidoreductase [Deltaproteobacteria bacterium]